MNENEKPVIVKIFHALTAIFNKRKSPTRTLKQLMEPLIESGVYRDKDAAIKAVIVDFIERKIEAYDKILDQLQQKHQKNFYEFSKELNAESAEETENDWMDWKLAIEMKENWQNAYRDSIDE